MVPEHGSDSAPAARNDEPLVLVSVDGHVGPRLADDLRPYCPADQLEAFDEMLAPAQEGAELFRQMTAGPDAPDPSIGVNLGTAGHYDADTRLAELDADGVACEAIYHGSLNGEMMPFDADLTFGARGEAPDLDLVAVGQDIYNRWLVDFCAHAPERWIGLVHLPMWDVPAAVKVLEWAREAGLRGVNFPAPRPFILRYDHPDWDPFWSACEDLGMALHTHSRPEVGLAELMPPPGGVMNLGPLTSIESAWPSRRGLGRMVFGGVFARHPGLRMVLTEMPPDWWTYTTREYDSAYLSFHRYHGEDIPELPSVYLRRQVFMGGSVPAPFEVEAAERDGYVENFLWGRDYPHPEGTWQFGGEPGTGASTTRLALRHAFASAAPDTVRAILGDNAVRAFALDESILQDVADRIGAPTAPDIAVPLDHLPDHRMNAFRTVGPYY